MQSAIKEMVSLVLICSYVINTVQPWSLNILQPMRGQINQRDYSMSQNFSRPREKREILISKQCILEGFHGQDLMVVVGFSGSLAVF